LRHALGYGRVTLVGGSYGSHLALALMRAYPQSIERVLMFGVEGLDHTWDDPGAQLSTLRRIAAAAEASPELAPHIPDGGLLAALHTVIDRLEHREAATRLEHREAATRLDRQPTDSGPVVNAALVRWLAGYQAGNRDRPNAWPEFILDMYDGDYSVAERAVRSLDTLSMDDPMHYSMDCASGISPDRATRYAADPARAILGDVNFEYAAFCDVWPARDPGAAFRASVVSDIPTLIVHGTWDTSTPIENAREVVATLRHGWLIEVDGGTHGALTNLFSHWDPAYDSIGAFLRGETIEFPATVTLPPVRFRARRAQH
ncbi:MAG: alpha/beta fold hydrolase, partial [Gemmatimonadetes bacterium]|nr:alpha/beta fold hydrolase [Gemmatimonadota bacterium]